MHLKILSYLPTDLLLKSLLLLLFYAAIFCLFQSLRGGKRIRTLIWRKTRRRYFLFALFCVSCAVFDMQQFQKMSRIPFFRYIVSRFWGRYVIAPICQLNGGTKERSVQNGSKHTQAQSACSAMPKNRSKRGRTQNPFLTPAKNFLSLNCRSSHVRQKSVDLRAGRRNISFVIRSVNLSDYSPSSLCLATDFFFWGGARWDFG